MRSEQFVVHSAASDCTGNEAPVAQDIGTRFFDVPAESQLLIRSSSTEASDTELGSRFFVLHAEFSSSVPQKLRPSKCLTLKSNC